MKVEDFVFGVSVTPTGFSVLILNNPDTPSKSLNDSFSFNPHLAKMLSRVVRGGRLAPPLKRNVHVYVPVSKRNVTTDAASSHAEREHVPEVRKAPPSESRANS